MIAGLLIVYAILVIGCVSAKMGAASVAPYDPLPAAGAETVLRSPAEASPGVESPHQPPALEPRSRQPASSPAEPTAGEELPHPTVSDSQSSQAAVIPRYFRSDQRGGTEWCDMIQRLLTTVRGNMCEFAMPNIAVVGERYPHPYRDRGGTEWWRGTRRCPKGPFIIGGTEAFKIRETGANVVLERTINGYSFEVSIGDTKHVRATGGSAMGCGRVEGAAVRTSKGWEIVLETQPPIP